MLNLFKRAPQERAPVDISAKGEIAASVSHVFDLLDFSSEKNALRERGFEFELEAGSFGLDDFKATDPAFPEAIFHFSVDTYVPEREIAFRTKIETENSPVGNFVESRSHYRLKALGENRCFLELTETTTLRDGLSDRAFQQEVATLVFSVERHLARITVHAVEGVEAATLV